MLAALGFVACFEKDGEKTTSTAPSTTTKTDPGCDKYEQGVKLSRGRGYIFGNEVQKNQDGSVIIKFSFDNGGTGQMALEADNIEEITPRQCVKRRISSVTLSGDSSCAIVADALQCWGNNDFGQLGDGTTTNRPAPVQVVPSGVIKVAMYTNQTCVNVGGALQCWGNNSLGQLGDGTTTNRPAPVQVISSGVTDMSMYAMGEGNCAIVGNTIAGGTLKCWGMNTTGNVGDGLHTGEEYPGPRLTPVQPISSGVTSVVMGMDYTCAIVSSALQCWGKNSWGQFADNRLLAFSWTPVQAIPSNVTALATGENHICAIVNSALQCWGLNAYGYGQVGDGGINGNATPPIQVIPPGVTAVSVFEHYTCAIVNSALQCWGRNTYGQIGDGTTIHRLTPVTVIPSHVTAVAMGFNHACAIVGEALQCWGGNPFGQLGDGTTISRLTPVQVIPSGVTSVAVGTSHTCATVNNALQCWGRNTYGQVGDGTTTDRLSPVLVIR